MHDSTPKKTPSRTFFLSATKWLGASLLLIILTILFYPYLKSGYSQLAGKTSQMFLDVTDSAGMKRHNSGANWLGTFSVSVVDYDNDGDEDIFSNNHERNRPYFYRNNGNGTFTEAYEAVGLLENPVGPVFGSPKIGAAPFGFYIWLDPATAINGMWHLRWTGQPGAAVSGVITTNTKIEQAQGVALSSSDQLKTDVSSIRFSASTGNTVKGIDLKSTFPESTVVFDLRINGKEDSRTVFIGPHSANPATVPFSLSLGDRHGTAWGDFNNDGNVDLFVTRGAMIGILQPPEGAKHEELFRNSPGGHFTNIITESQIRNDYGRGRDVQWVDYDNDGLLDLYVSNIGAKNLLFHNRGDGTFEEVGKAAGLDFVGRTHFIWADFNHDGRPDVLFSNPEALFLNNGDGKFTDATRAYGLNFERHYESFKDAMFWGSGASTADYDNDGDLDVFVASGRGGGKSRLLENRDGTFVDVTDKASIGNLKDVREGIWADFDNDGHVDLYTISLDPGSNRLYRNNGDDTFTDVTEKENLSLSDRFDWDLSSHAGGVATWVDYDNDGFLDLFLATRRVREPKAHDKEDAVQSSGKLTEFLHFLAEKAHEHMKGKVQGTHFLFKNTGNGNHWVKIKLSGTRSNRDGFGAKVLVTVQNMTQYQEAGASGKMLFAQNNSPLHFGLGQADTVTSIKVMWPSGKVQIVNNIHADQIVRLEEPKE
jgi:hypothetical protein